MNQAIITAPPDFAPTTKNSTKPPGVASIPPRRCPSIKPTTVLAIALAFSSALFATDKDKPTAPIVIPLTGSGQATTSKLGNSYITRAEGGQTFTTSQLGSSTITRDSKGNTWTTTQLGNNYVTRGPDGQQQTTTKLGNSFVTRDSKTGSTLTTSPLGNSLQTRSNSDASWSTSPLGSSLVTRSTEVKKDEKTTTRVIVIPGAR